MSFTKTPGPSLLLRPTPGPAQRRAPHLFGNSLTTNTPTPRHPAAADPRQPAARAPPTGNRDSGSQPRALGTAQLMSNAPASGGAGEEPPPPPPDATAAPDTPRHPEARSPPAGGPKARVPSRGSALAGLGAAGPGPRALRRHCTCHGCPSRPARGREAGARAPRGAVLRAWGLSLPRLHSPDEITAVTVRAQGRSQRCTERARKQGEEEEDGWPTPLHSVAVGALRWEPPRERGTAPALGARPGAGSGWARWREGGAGGGEGAGLAWGWRGAGVGWEEPTRSRAPWRQAGLFAGAWARAPGASAGGCPGNERSPSRKVFPWAVWAASS